VPTHPQLRADLMKKLGGISKQRLSDRVAQVKKAHGPMTTEDAVYLLAHQSDLDLPRYLDPGTVDRVRGMLQVTATRAPMSAPPAAPRSLALATRSRPQVRINTDPPSAPLLTAAVAEDAKIMAKVYAQLYVLENSARDVIHRVMTAKHGKDWWSKKAGSKVQQRVQGREDKEDKEPWTGKRGAHEISYTDFGDLERIILNNWSDFEDILGSTSFVTSTLGGLEPLRNITAHNNRAAKKEVDRLRIHFDDWVKQIDGRKATIP
jgi:hypothetical protein